MIYLLTLVALLLLNFGGNAKMVEKRLDNGVKLIVKETEGKGIVSAVMFIKAGQWGEKLRGETNLLMNLLIKESKNFSTYEVASTFEDYGGYIYASSADDYSEIGFSTHRDGLEKALKVFKDLLLNPALKEEDIEREKRNTIIAIRSKREKGFQYAMEHLRKLTYEGTPYETSPLGTEEDIQKIDRNHLLRRLKEILKGKNVVFALVGDVKAQEVLPKLEKILSLIPQGEYEPPVKDSQIKEDKVLKVKREGTQATILCAFNAPPITSDDYFSFKVLVSLLGDGMTSKLFKELREKKGYAYATFAFYPTRISSPRMFSYIGTSPDKRENALKDMLKVIKELKVEEQEVELAKNKIIGDFLLDHQTRMRQAWYLGFYEVVGFGWKMDSQYPERIKKVSAEHLTKAAEIYTKLHHCVMVEPF